MRAFRKRVEQKDAPFLAPLGTSYKTRRERFSDALGHLPSIAAPIAFTLVGCLIIIVVLGSFLAGGQDRTPRQSQADPIAPATESLGIQVPDIADAQPVPNIATPQPDLGRTASIPAAVPPPSALRPKVEIAESEDEITALEEEQRTQREAGNRTDTETAVAPPAPEMRAATITTAVNMRAEASDEAKVLEVVPARAQIQAEEDCDWCPVVYEGRTGYIYRSFISYQ